MRNVFLALVFVCLEANASQQCFVLDDETRRNSEKHKHQFEVTTYKSEDASFDVLVEFPKLIDGKKFRDVYIIIGAKEDPVFFSSLKPNEFEGVAKVYFVAKPTPNEPYALNFAYGIDECGFEIRIPIEFE